MNAKTLVRDYNRLSPIWLKMNGLDSYFKVVYQNKTNDKDFLICLTCPKKRPNETRQKDWIISIDGMRIFEKTRPNDSARIFLTNEKFDWALADYPESCHICADGATADLREMNRHVRENDNLLIRGRIPVIFFGEDFVPKTERGICPINHRVTEAIDHNHSKIIIHDVGGKTHHLYVTNESELPSLLDIVYKFCSVDSPIIQG